MTITAFSTASGRADHPDPGRTRVLWVACGAHALHDGLTDTLYLLLPLWQAQFALSYAAIGLLRALYTGVMAGFQVPAAKLAQRMGGARMLAGGTAVAAVAYLLLGASSSVALLAVALVLGGIGSSTQHPIASSLVATAYEGPRSRGALGTYNFAGDLGKMALPSITACLIAVISWRWTGTAVGVIGLLGAGAILLSLRAVTSASAVRTPIPSEQGKAADWTKLLRNGFPLLLTIGVIDSATRMGFLTFLPFLLQSKGAGLPEIGLALTMVFAGGAAGKLVCGFLGARLGVLPTVLLTEGATAVGILALSRCRSARRWRCCRLSALRSTARHPCSTAPCPTLCRPTDGRALLVFFTRAPSAPGHYHPFYTDCSAMRSALPRRCCLSPRLFC